MRRSGSWSRAAGLLAVAVCIPGVGAGIPAAAQGEKVAAIVNGDVITEGEFFDRLQRLHGQSFLIGNNQLRPESAGHIVLDAIITEHLTLQAANKAHVELSDAETEAELANLRRQPTVAAGLTGHLFTEEMLKYDIRVQGARYKLATAGVKVSPEDVQKFYQAHIADYTLPERWGLSVIRTTSAETLAKIDADLNAGKSFADTARAYSEDPASKLSGGDVGVVAANDPGLLAVLRDAVRPLKPGQVTPSVKVESDPGGGRPKITTWFRILVRSKEPAGPRPFDAIKAGLERPALIEKAGGYKTGDSKIALLRSQSDIKINLPGYEDLAARR